MVDPPTTATPSWAEVLELVAKFDDSHYEDVDLQVPGLHLRMSTSPTAFAPHESATPSAVVPGSSAETTAAPHTGRAEPPPAEPAPPEPAAPSPTAVEVTTPMLGTFYRRPSPDAAPFVEVGAQVDADTTVAIIEVMKLMNPVTAGVVGRLLEVCAEDGDLVEHGQVLFRVEPGSTT